MKCEKCSGWLEIIKVEEHHDFTIYTFKGIDCGDVTTIREDK